MKRMILTTWYTCLAALFAIALSSAAGAVVVNLDVSDNGKAVGEATVVLIDMANGEEKEMATDGEGKLTIELRDGEYKIVVKSGFFGPPDQTANISTDIGQEAANTGSTVTPNGAVATAIAAALGTAKPSINDQKTSPMILVNVAGPLMTFFLTFDVSKPVASLPSGTTDDGQGDGFNNPNAD